MQLLIPAAKLVSRELQSIGKLPAIIYPVNKGIVFDYLYKQYRDVCTSIDVVCYEETDKVCNKLENYNSEQIHVLDLPELKDLGYTVYYALKDEHAPVIINFADTIVFDDIYEYAGDSFFYNKDFCSDTWTYFCMRGG